MGWFEKCPEMGKYLIRIQILFGLLEKPEREATTEDKNELHSPDLSWKKYVNIDARSYSVCSQFL